MTVDRSRSCTVRIVCNRLTCLTPITATSSEAQALYARTPSLEEILERAHRSMLAAERNRLAAAG